MPGRARAEQGKIEPMPGLRRYVEWMARGRRTDRVVYIFEERSLPKPLPGAEWQLDAKFNVADELLRDPEFKAVLRRRSTTAPGLSSRRHRWDE